VLRHAAAVLLDTDTPQWDGRATVALLGDCRIRGMHAGRYRNVLGGQQATVDQTLSPSDWLAPLPVAVLEQLPPAVS
jgi:(1->4)-alpha-D-glucan 1-alpha-D-glucosylmutase